MPEGMHRSRHADEFSRCIERAGQIVGDETQGRRYTAAARLAGPVRDLALSQSLRRPLSYVTG
ncbi:MAG: hypothetical protein ACJ8AI_13830, partial [Rhodopila sp.]